MVSDLEKIVSNLIVGLKSLHSFVEIADSEYKAQGLLDQAIAEIDTTERQEAALQVGIRSFAQAHSEKSFLQKISGKGSAWKKVEEELQQCSQELEQLNELAGQIQNAIDLTPNNPEQRKTLIKDLRMEKKELGLAKKEINLELRGISRRIPAEIRSHSI